MFDQVQTAYSSNQCRTGHKESFSTTGRQTELSSYRPLRLNLHGQEDFCADRERIARQLSFLKPCHELIHSLVLVGSTAYNLHTANSDIDIVIITTLKGHEKVCSFLFEKEIDESLHCKERSNIEYTVLSSENVEELFQTSSPFAYSIRHGIAIRDDGFLLLLLNKPFPKLPQDKYYTDCLYEHIATPYFGLLKKFKVEAQGKGCTLGCQKKTQGCKGLLSAQLFAKLVMKMFYVTLPARGMVPLTKSDVITHAKTAYGSKGEIVAKQVVSLLRNKRSSFCFDEYMQLKRFAVKQYREILHIAGLSRRVREIIFDAARICRQDFQSISNPSMKNCVL